MNINCPYCKYENIIECDDLPRDVSTDENYTCVSCDDEFQIGIHAELEIRGTDKGNGKKEINQSEVGVKCPHCEYMNNV